MNVPDNNSHIWPLARSVVLLIVLGLCLYFNYDTFDPIKDPRAMILVALGVGAFDFIKSLVAPKPPPSP